MGPQNFAVAAHPFAVIVADVNRDGKTDLVAADRGNNTLSVLLGNGNGTFQAMQNFATQTNPDALAVVDANGDGKPDLVAANYGSNSVSVLLGNGNGTFLAAQNFSTGSKPVFVVAGDLNRDGKFDLMVANNGANSVSILLGNGNGTFKAAQTFSAGAQPSGLATGDLNGDGKSDLAISNQASGNVSVLLGNGDGSFLGAQNFTAGTGATSVVVADVNGDANLDLVASNKSANSLSVLLGNGNGTFKAAQNLATDSSPAAVAARDVNGDGAIDLIAANYGSATVSVMLGNGNGSFFSARNFPTGAGASGVAVADVNGDGRPELITADATINMVSVLQSDSAAPGLGTFQSAQKFNTGALPYAVVTADLQHDGKLDIVTANRTGNSISVLLGNGDGTFQANQDYPAGSNPRGLTVADLRGDGKLDLIYTSYNSNQVSIRLGNGDGTFGAPQNFGTGSRPISVVATDVNGDGKLDLVIADYFQNSGTLLLGNGDGTFHSGPDITTGPFNRSFAIADLNLDGKPDAISAVEGLNQLSVSLGNGDGSFQTPHTFTTGPSPWMVGVADVNSDGKPDLILPNFSGNSAGVMLGNGDGTFQAISILAATSGPSAVAAADIQGDGKLDLVAANEGGSTLSVFLGNGDGTFGKASDFISGSYPDALSIADVNGDGKPDLVAANYTGKNASVLLGNRNAATHLQVGGPANTAAGSVFSINVTALTPENRSDWLYTGKVHFTSSDPAAVLPADTSFSINDYGSRAFDVTLNTGGSQTVTATDAANGTILGQFTINVDGQPPTQLVLLQQPGDSTAGTALQPSVRVAIEDRTGSVVTGSSLIVTMTIHSGPGAFDNSSTVQVAAVNGIATFSNLVLDVAGTYSLTATAGSLSSATTGTFVVTFASASKLAFLQEPGNTLAGAAINPGVVIAVEDQFGNLVTSDTSIITLGIQTGPGAFDSASTLQVAATSGVATFSNLILDMAGSYTLSASAAGLTSVNSSILLVGATEAAELEFGQQPFSSTANLVISPAVTVTVRDRFGNLVANDASTVTLVLAGGTAGAKLKGTLQAAAINGVATFSDLAVDTVGSDYTLHATDGALLDMSSATFDIAGPATHVVFLQQPGASVAGAVIDAGLNPAGVRVAIEDDLGNIVATNSSIVTLGLTGGAPGAVLHGTVSVMAVNGVATFTDLSINTAATAYALMATDGALAGATSTPFTVSAGPASQLVLGQVFGSGTAGQAISPGIAVTVEDRFGNVVTSDSSTITMTIHGGPGVFDANSTTQATVVNGVATFGNLILDTAGSYSLAPVDGALTSPNSATVVIQAGAASQLAFLQQPTNSVAGSPISPPVTVTVTDGFGNPVNSNVSTVSVAIHSGPGQFDNASTIQVPVSNGIASFGNLIFDVAGSYTLTVSAGSLSAGTSTSFAVRAAAATQLAFRQQPSDSLAGSAVGPAVSVLVEDRFGNLVSDNTTAVSMLIHGGPGLFDSSSTLQATAVNGVATFSKLILDSSGSYTLAATAGALASTSSSGFIVSAAVPARLAFLQQPTNTRAGQPGAAPAIVAILDSFGNFATSDSSVLTVSIQSGPGGFAGGSTLQATATGGMATFSNLILNTAGLYTLAVTDGSLSMTVSSSFLVRAGDASRLAVHLQASQVAAGTVLTPAVGVTVEDAFGNVVGSDSSTVTLASATGPGTFEARSTTQAVAVNGVATFNNLALDTAGNYTLSATDGSLASGTSTTLTVSAASAGQLAFVQQPAGAIAGVAFSPTIAVAVEDAFGNVVKTGTFAISLGIQAGPGIFESGGTVQASTSNGIASFGNLILDTPGSYAFSATSTTLSPAVSGNLVVSPAIATHLVFTRQPSDATAGAALDPGVTIAIEDQFGNIVLTNNSTVTLSIHSGPGVFEGGSSVSVAAVKGVAQFSNLILDAAGAYTISATLGSLQGANSASFAISAGLASQVVFHQLPSSPKAGVILAPAITVAIEDRFGNILTTDTSTVSITIQNGPGSFAGTAAKQAKAVNGVASFANLILDTAGTYALAAGDGSLSPGLTSLAVAGGSGTGSPAGFVASLYQFVLNRKPDAGGLAYWTQQIAGGTSRLQIAQGFWASFEHRGLQVDQYYSTYLHRASEASGRAFWVAAFSGGLDERGIALGFVKSAEYQANNPTNTTYITAIYADAFGRKPDASGLAYWEMVGSTPRGQPAIANGIFASGEEVQVALDRLYTNLLFRKPDAGGEQYWAALLQAGFVSQSDVAEAFLASDEFFNKATS